MRRHHSKSNSIAAGKSSRPAGRRLKKAAARRGNKGDGMTYEAAGHERQQSVPLHARIDLIGGVLMVAIAVLVWFGAIELSMGDMRNLGSGALPKALAVLLALGGAGILVQALFRRDPDAERFEFALRPVLIIVLAIVLFALFIRGGDFGLMSTPQLGLSVVGPITVFLAGSAAPDTKARELLVLAFGITGAVLFVFSDLLGLSIPPFPGALQDVIPPSLGREAALRITCICYGVIAATLYFILVRADRSRA